MEKSVKDLIDAEDFFDYYQLPYDPKIVSVTRLHILKRFRQYMETENLQKEDLLNSAIWEKQRSLLSKAYHDFVQSTPLQEKVFPVFHEGQSACHSLSLSGKCEKGCSGC